MRMTLRRSFGRALLPAVAIVSSSGCASIPARRPPTADELRLVRAVEVRSVASGIPVRPLAWADPAAAARATSPAPPGIALGVETERAIADAVVAAGSCETTLRFGRAAEPGSEEGGAILEAKLLSATLATGAGPDPLTALWVRFETRLALPPTSPGALAAEPSWLGPARGLAVDPQPRPLSEWVADGGAKVRAAVAALSRQLASSWVADLRGGAPAAARCGSGSGPAQDGVAQPAAQPRALTDAARAATPAAVRVELVSPDRSAASGWTALGVLGGGVLGIVLGAGSGFGECTRGVHANDAVSGIVVGICAAVAMPVGALVGMARGIDAGARWGDRQRADRLAEHARKARAIDEAARPVAVAAALATNEVLANPTGADAGAPPVLGTMRVRLLEDGGDPPLAQLELELTVAAGQDGAERRLCLRGPGPVPTALWLDGEAGLLRASVEAQIARGVASAAAGFDPQPGDGACPATTGR